MVSQVINKKYCLKLLLKARKYNNYCCASVKYILCESNIESLNFLIQ